MREILYHIRKEVKELGIEILGVGTDGDLKLLKFMRFECNLRLHKFKQKNNTSDKSKSKKNWEKCNKKSNF